MSRPLAGIGHDKLTAIFSYLDGLRASGQVNMFGARPYVSKMFPGLGYEQALVATLAWARAFDLGETADFRASKAIELEQGADVGQTSSMGQGFD